MTAHGHTVTRGETTATRVTAHETAHRESERNKAVLKHMNIVIKKAHGLSHQRGRFVEDDLIQEGAIGLMNASERFDPSKGDFVQFASTCIRWSMVSWIDKDGYNGIGGLHNSIRTEARKKRKGLPYNTDKDSAIDGIPQVEYSLNKEAESVPEYPEVDKMILRLDLYSIMKGALTPREVSILTDLFGLETGVPMREKEACKKYHVTQQRISQVKKEALTKLKDAIGEKACGLLA